MSFDFVDGHSAKGRPASTGVVRGDFALAVGEPNVELPSGWRWCALTKIARLESGHTPSRKHPEYWNGNIPWVGIKDATANHGQTITKTNQYASALGIENSSARVLPAGTVCLSRTASVGYVVVMGVPMATSQDFVNWVCGPSLSNEYLKYILLAEKNSFLRFASGTTHQTIYFPEVKAFHIALPPLSEQEKIVAMLGALDDRITLLRETNATLEAIAQALFKSWFVDFDPVRAKAEGRQPEGMDATTAALFPDSFEESELVVVPKGWSITSVAQVAEVVKGKSYSSKDLVEAHGTALVTLKSFSRGGGFRLDGFKPYTGSYKPAQVVVPGDLIIAYTDVTQAAELIGKPAIVVGLDNYKTLVASLDVGVVRPDFQKVSRQYLYGLFRTESFQSHTFAHTSGTTVLHLAKDGVGSYQFPCPPLGLVQSFSTIADALSERCQNNIDQMQTLTQLRDTLLPRLISGQLRLSEAEALIEEAV